MRNGYGVARLCSSAEEVLPALQQIPAELVVMDEDLGEVHGAARLARSIIDSTGVPVVFVGHGRDRQRFHRLRLADPFGFVVLPLADNVLQVTLDLAFHRLDLERQRAMALPGRNAAHERLKEHEGLLPLCAGCKRITAQDGRWLKLEEYFARHAGVSFTHSLCPDCEERLYAVPAPQPEVIRSKRKPTVRKSSVRT